MKDHVEECMKHSGPGGLAAGANGDKGGGPNSRLLTSAAQGPRGRANGGSAARLGRANIVVITLVWLVRRVCGGNHIEGALVKEFLTGLVLPFTAVSVTIVGLTLALFNVPATDAPSPRIANATRATSRHATGALTVDNAFAHALERAQPSAGGRGHRDRSSSTRTVSLAVAKAGAPTPLGSAPPRRRRPIRAS